MHSEITRSQEIATSLWAIRIIIRLGVISRNNMTFGMPHAEVFRAPGRLLAHKRCTCFGAGPVLTALDVTTFTPTRKSGERKVGNGFD
jgi:hypothetical protein